MCSLSFNVFLSFSPAIFNFASFCWFSFFHFRLQSAIWLRNLANEMSAHAKEGADAKSQQNQNHYQNQNQNQNHNRRATVDECGRDQTSPVADKVGLGCSED